MKGSGMAQEVITGLLALIAVVGTFALISYQTVNRLPVAVPDIVIAMDFSVIGTYFGRALAQNGARQAGTAAAQVAVQAAQTAPNVPGA